MGEENNARKDGKYQEATKHLQNIQDAFTETLRQKNWDTERLLWLE